MRFRLLVLALAMLVTLPAGAQDAAGSWTGEMPVQGGEQQEITFELAVDGSTVTGTATSEFTGTVEISEGTVDGSTIAFKHLVDFNGNEITFAYTGTISGDDMTLTRTIEGAAAVVPNNFIDQHIFGAMVADNVSSAPDAGTTEILRRLSLDLTGRIPTIEKIEEFVASDDPTKRDKLIDELIASEAFVDNWTAYFANHFEVTSNYYNFVGIPGRNLFYDYIRDFVARDRSYADVVTELIASSGDSHELGPVNFLVRGIQQGDPIQDT